MSQLDISEMLVCGEQLLAVLVGDNTEMTTLKTVQEMSQQVADLRQKQLLQLKDDVQFLTSEMNMDSDTDTANGTSNSPDVADIEAALTTRAEAVHSQSAAVVRECEQIREELAKAQREQQDLRGQRQSQKEAKTAALPKARCDVNLYSNITNLRWQYNCQPHEVRGYICNNNDVKTFSLNSQEVSRFFIANYIWDLIEEDW